MLIMLAIFSLKDKRKSILFNLGTHEDQFINVFSIKYIMHVNEVTDKFFICVLVLMQVYVVVSEDVYLTCQY